MKSQLQSPPKNHIFNYNFLNFTSFQKLSCNSLKITCFFKKFSFYINPLSKDALFTCAEIEPGQRINRLA